MLYSRRFASGARRAAGQVVQLTAFAALLLYGLQAQARGVPESFADLADALLPTVVNISTSQVVEGGPGAESFEDLFREFFERHGEGAPSPRQRRQSSLGSGFVIDAEGYIVTNHHVVDGADEITVRLHDNTSLRARLIGTDDKTDLALLKVESTQPLPAARWGDSDAARVGDWVLAIGNPFGLGGTVTAGIISAQARNIDAGPYDDFIQTDAAINRGNSGGPMFNLEGRVIGVNSAIFSPSGGSVGIGFAVSSSLARPVIEQLRDFGQTRRGWLGVRIQSITPEIAEGLGRGSNVNGALVAGITSGGPAEGVLRPGDIVLSFNAQPIREMRDLPRIVATTAVGSEASVRVWRDGVEETLVVTLGELEAAEQSGMLATESTRRGPGQQPQERDDSVQVLRTYGLELAAVDEQAAQQFGLTDTEGVVITGVLPNSAAAARGLAVGEVIYEVNQTTVSRPSDVVAAIQAARDQGRSSVLLFVGRDGDLRFVALNIEAG